MDAILQKRHEQAVQFRLPAVQVLCIDHHQHIHLARRGGAHQIHHAGAQRERLCFAASLSEQFHHAGPLQFAQRPMADQLLLAHGQIRIFDFLDKSDCSHGVPPFCYPVLIVIGIGQKIIQAFMCPEE